MYFLLTSCCNMQTHTLSCTLMHHVCRFQFIHILFASSSAQFIHLKCHFLNLLTCFSQNQISDHTRRRKTSRKLLIKATAVSCTLNTDGILLIHLLHCCLFTAVTNTHRATSGYFKQMGEGSCSGFSLNLFQSLSQNLCTKLALDCVCI